MENYASKLARLQARKHKPLIVKTFDESDLRCGHRGLGLMARKSNVDINRLPAGEFLLFINKAGTAVKLLANGNVLIHLKSATSEVIETQVIEMLPRLFNGTDFDFKASARLGLKVAA